MLIIKGGTINDCVTQYPYQADILVRDGKIAKIAPQIDIEGASVIDASGLSVYPGFVDVSSTAGLCALSDDDFDLTAELIEDPVIMRAADALDPADPLLAACAAHGTTTVCSGVGIASPMSGARAAYKTRGHIADAMLLDDHLALDCMVGDGQDGAVASLVRMTAIAAIRELLLTAQAYISDKETGRQVSYDPDCEALGAMLMDKCDLWAWCASPVDAFCLLRTLRDFNISPVLGLACQSMRDDEATALAERTKRAILVRPANDDARDDACEGGGGSEGDDADAAAAAPKKTSADESTDKWELPAMLCDKGCEIAIGSGRNADPSVLLASATAAIAAGMDRFEALKAITINAAKLLGLGEQIGSIEQDKDADLVVVDGSPFHKEHTVKHVIVNGELA